jgi:hypothetical protein
LVDETFGCESSTPSASSVRTSCFVFGLDSKPFSETSSVDCNLTANKSFLTKGLNTQTGTGTLVTTSPVAGKGSNFVSSVFVDSNQLFSFIDKVECFRKQLSAKGTIPISPEKLNSVSKGIKNVLGSSFEVVSELVSW